MASKVRGDYTLDGLAVELVSKLAALRAQHLKVQDSFEDDMQQLLTNADFPTLRAKLVDASGVLFKGDPKEVPGVFNIIFELLDTIDKDEASVECPLLAKKLISLVAVKEAPRSETRIVVLAGLYNADFIKSPALSELRFSVLRALIKYAATCGKLRLIDSFLENSKTLEAQLSSTDVTVATKRQVLVDAYDALRVAGKNTVLEQEYLLKYLQTFDAEAEHSQIDSGVQSLACTAISACIGNVLAANGRQLQSLQVVKNLTSAGGSKMHLVTLLGIFNHGVLADYIAFQAEHPSVLQEFGIDHENVVRSMRLLSLCTACNAAKDGRLSYDNAAKAMGLESSGDSDLSTSVEEWVLMAIKTRLVDVKMCQETQLITVYSSTQRSFQKEEWKDMKRKITRWKVQVKKLLLTVESIRRNQQHGLRPITR